jgi:predicted enzyme related to lactoylglutathione lyase
MPSIAHFEIPADDPERARKFYGELFDWKLEKTPGPADYWLIQSSEDEEGISGGLVKRQEPQKQILVYFNVSSALDYGAKVEELGGKILTSKTAVAGYGHLVVCEDTEGNVFALWEKDKGAA